MSFVIKDKDRIFVCCFARTSEDQFTLLVTNCQQFFSEILSAEVFKERRNEVCCFRLSEVRESHELLMIILGQSQLPLRGSTSGESANARFSSWVLHNYRWVIRRKSQRSTEWSADVDQHTAHQSHLHRQDPSNENLLQCSKLRNVTDRTLLYDGVHETVDRTRSAGR